MLEIIPGGGLMCVMGDGWIFWGVKVLILGFLGRKIRQVFLWGVA